MSGEIVVVGFTCPACHQRVPVIASNAPPPRLDHGIVSQCKCGFVRDIPLETIQELEVWKENSGTTGDGDRPA